MHVAWARWAVARFQAQREVAEERPDAEAIRQRIVDIPAGTPLHIRACDWRAANRDAGDVDLVTAEINGQIHLGEVAGDAWVWLTGHDPACGWQAADLHEPCVQLWVRVSAILDADR